MAGVVGAAARGAMEASERGGQPQADLAGVQGVEGSGGVAWDHAAFPKGKAVEETRLRWVYQSPYFFEFNPAERVSEEVWRWVEGRRYERTEAKKAAGEGVLQGLEAGGKVSSPVGWRHIRQALNALPS